MDTQISKKNATRADTAAPVLVCDAILLPDRRTRPGIAPPTAPTAATGLPYAPVPVSTRNRQFASPMSPPRWHRRKNGGCRFPVVFVKRKIFMVL